MPQVWHVSKLVVLEVMITCDEGVAKPLMDDHRIVFKCFFHARSATPLVTCLDDLTCNSTFSELVLDYKQV